MFAAGIVLLVAMTGLDQDMMQRNLSCATPRDSQRTSVLTAVSQIVIFCSSCWACFYLYMERSGMAAPAKSDQVFFAGRCRRRIALIVGILFCCRTYFRKYLFSCRVGPRLSRPLSDVSPRHRRYGDARLTRIRRGVHVAMALRIAGGVILALEVLDRRQRHQSGLQGRQLYLRSDSGHVRLPGCSRA